MSHNNFHTIFYNGWSDKCLMVDKPIKTYQQNCSKKFPHTTTAFVSQKQKKKIVAKKMLWKLILY